MMCNADWFLTTNPSLLGIGKIFWPGVARGKVSILVLVFDILSLGSTLVFTWTSFSAGSNVSSSMLAAGLLRPLLHYLSPLSRAFCLTCCCCRRCCHRHHCHRCCCCFRSPPGGQLSLCPCPCPVMHCSALLSGRHFSQPYQDSHSSHFYMWHWAPEHPSPWTGHLPCSPDCWMSSLHSSLPLPVSPPLRTTYPQGQAIGVLFSVWDSGPVALGTGITQILLLPLVWLTTLVPGSPAQGPHAQSCCHTDCPVQWYSCRCPQGLHQLDCILGRLSLQPTLSPGWARPTSCLQDARGPDRLGVRQSLVSPGRLSP